MIPLQDKNALLVNLLPENPKPGQVIEVPKGQISAGQMSLTFIAAIKLIGTTTQLMPIQNVSGKYEIARTTTNTKLSKNDVIRVVGRQYIFNSVIFVDYFGWLGYGHSDEPQILSDKTYKILHVMPIGPTTKDCYLYEKICLETIMEDANEPNEPNPATVTK